MNSSHNSPVFQIRSRSEVLGIRTSTFFGHNSSHNTHHKELKCVEEANLTRVKHETTQEGMGQMLGSPAAPCGTRGMRRDLGEKEWRFFLEGELWE